jgi:hypothetical protein
MALPEPQEPERDHDQSDRHVEHEDPLPREALGDGTADNGSRKNRQASDGIEQAERPGPLRTWKRLAQQGHRQRHDECAAEALDRPARYQPARAGASAHAAEATVNKASPIANMRRRPSRSPMAAAAIKNPAKLSV